MLSAVKMFDRMISFIEKDADEKVEEIEESADHGFEVRKANCIRQGCIQIEKEFETRVKKLEMDTLIFKSQKEATARLELAHCRHACFQDTLSSFKSQVYTAIDEMPDLYEATLKLLIEQAVLKVLCPSMRIFIQEKDKGMVKKMLPSINWFYTETTKLKADIALDTGHFLNPEKDMKVIVTALQNRVICEASLEKRLHCVVSNATPYIKKALFDCN